MPPLSLPYENYHLTQHLSSLARHWAGREGSAGGVRIQLWFTQRHDTGHQPGLFLPFGPKPAGFPPSRAPPQKWHPLIFPLFSDITNSYFPFILIAVFWSLFLFSVILLSGTEDLVTWATVSRQGVKWDPKGPPIPWNTWFL